MNQSETFIYWKKPWHKWIVLGTAALQTIALWLRIKDFIVIYQCKTELFSLTEWENYARSQLLQITLSGIVIAIFLGCFIIGFFARSDKMVHMSMGILFLFVSVGCGIVGYFMNTLRILWVTFLIVSLIASINSLWKIRRL